jgi:ribosomal protein S20
MQATKKISEAIRQWLNFLNINEPCSISNLGHFKKIYDNNNNNIIDYNHAAAKVSRLSDYLNETSLGSC